MVAGSVEYSMRFFCAQDDPVLAGELIGKYAKALEEDGIQHVMSLDIPKNSPRVYFVCVSDGEGNNVGAMGAYIFCPDGGLLERSFCSVAPEAAPRFQEAVKDGLAKVCFGWVDPEHRRKGLYPKIIRALVAVLPALGIYRVTALGSAAGVRYYGKFGLVPDKSVGQDGELAYPSGGFVSHLGWADLRCFEHVRPKEREAIRRIRTELVSEKSVEQRRRRHTSVLNERIQKVGLLQRR